MGECITLANVLNFPVSPVSPVVELRFQEFRKEPLNPPCQPPAWY